VIRWFGERAKIFNVHFRSIKCEAVHINEKIERDSDAAIEPALCLRLFIAAPTASAS
jgi:D-mannonate dehydratase